MYDLFIYLSIYTKRTNISILSRQEYPLDPFKSEPNYMLTEAQRAALLARKAPSEATLLWPDDEGAPCVRFAFVDGQALLLPTISPRTDLINHWGFS